MHSQRRFISPWVGWFTRVTRCSEDWFHRTLSSKDPANLWYILRVPKARCLNSVCVRIRCEKSSVKFSNIWLFMNDDVFFIKTFIDYAKTCGVLYKLEWPIVENTSMKQLHRAFNTRIKEHNTTRQTTGLERDRPRFVGGDRLQERATGEG